LWAGANMKFDSIIRALNTPINIGKKNKGFISFSKALRMTKDVFRKKWTAIFFAVVSVYGIAFIIVKALNRFDILSFPHTILIFFFLLAPGSGYPLWEYILFLALHFTLVSYGFLTISYIVDDYFRNQKSSVIGALKFFASRLKNHIVLTLIFVSVARLWDFAANFFPELPSLLGSANFIIIGIVLIGIVLTRYVYAFFACAFFNYGAFSAVKLSFRLTKGFSVAIFIRTFILIVFEGALFLAALIPVFLFYILSGFFIGLGLIFGGPGDLIDFMPEWATLEPPYAFGALYLAAFFLIYQSLIFLNLFNLKQDINNLEPQRRDGV
jgi:hypothetical protein